MTYGLHNLRKSQKTKKGRRIGRGHGSGRGAYSGRGIKGQKARTGGRHGLKRRGLKQYLMQIPKARGFKRATNLVGVSLSVLEKDFKEGEHINPKVLVTKGYVKHGSRIKLLGHTPIKKKLSFTVHAASSGAKRAIEKAGGTLHIITY